MTPLPRLRQVALVTHDRAFVEKQLQATFGWTTPFHDPGVGQFGLDNAVFAASDTFIEVLSPVRPDTTAGRYLQRRDGDSGYMAIFQVEDVTAARERIAGAGIRTVWQADLPDMAGTHLHPKDVPGAIVSIDWAAPPGSWRWAGPDWIGHASPHQDGGISGLVVEVKDPATAAGVWASALGVEAASHGAGARIDLTAAAQVLRFVPISSERGEGLTEVTLRVDTTTIPNIPPTSIIGGVRFTTEAVR